MMGGGYTGGDGLTLYPVIAPALILVGATMMDGVKHIDGRNDRGDTGVSDDPVMPLSFSITDGIAFGFMAYAVLKVATGRGRELHWLLYVIVVAFLARYVFL